MMSITEPGTNLLYDGHSATLRAPKCGRFGYEYVTCILTVRLLDDCLETQLSALLWLLMVKC
jgi:hypothetical protein